MSRKRTTYSADFKAKIVLEVLEGEKTINELASKYSLLPKNIQNWKKQFLENASLAFVLTSLRDCRHFVPRMIRVQLLKSIRRRYNLLKNKRMRWQKHWVK
ncbi:MAG: transposase [Campylobacteraceae bacterium]|nr:transposase [Campylobacteraceae bacterium]